MSLAPSLPAIQPCPSLNPASPNTQPAQPLAPPTGTAVPTHWLSPRKQQRAFASGFSPGSSGALVDYMFLNHVHKLMHGLQYACTVSMLKDLSGSSPFADGTLEALHLKGPENIPAPLCMWKVGGIFIQSMVVFCQYFLHMLFILHRTFACPTACSKPGHFITIYAQLVFAMA